MVPVQGTPVVPVEAASDAGMRRYNLRSVARKKWGEREEAKEERVKGRGERGGGGRRLWPQFARRNERGHSSKRMTEERASSKKKSRRREEEEGKRGGGECCVSFLRHLAG